MTLVSTICSFYIGMGNVMVNQGHELERQKNSSPLERLAFVGSSLSGMGYLIAWLVVSYQPIFKLIPVLILATIAGVFGGFLTREGITPWVPGVGVVVMPLMFHISRYLELV